MNIPVSNFFRGNVSEKLRHKTIGNLIDKQNVSFISSIGDDGFPYTKAIATPRKREEIKVFYFTTNTSSMRVAQYRNNPKACIYILRQNGFSGGLC